MNLSNSPFNSFSIFCKMNTLLAGLFLTASLFLTQQANAQAPQSMSYQSVIRNSSNALVANTAVGIKISMLQGSTTGNEAYVETQTATTNANGLVSLQIGTGTADIGAFSEIDWANGPYFIKTEIDPTGGSNYSITGTQQITSVPYALYAAKSGGAVFETTADDPSAIFNTNTGNVGIGTDLPSEKLDVNGNIKSSENMLASSFVKAGGTSSQFLMADGSVNEELLVIIATMQAQILALQDQIAGLIQPTLPTVVIGTQTWTSTNLNVATYRDGTPIPEVQDPEEWANLTTGAWCHLNNDPANDAIYGKMYNHYAVADPRGLAPVGYHVPTFAEYGMMIETIPPGAECYNNSAWYNAPALMSPGFYGGTNTTGFSALNGGWRTGDAIDFFPPGEPAGQFKTFGTSFWSSDAEGNYNYIYLLEQCAIGSTDRPSNHGAYVRLIKD